MVYPKLNIVRW